MRVDGILHAVALGLGLGWLWHGLLLIGDGVGPIFLFCGLDFIRSFDSLGLCATSCYGMPQIGLPPVPSS
jgi:hypothetical protein